jgi:hypothetical protein
MISFLFVICGAVCNAVMDVTSHHFHESIFSKIKNKKVNRWFRSYDSWKLKYEWYDDQIVGRKTWKGIRIPVQITDAWHFFKMLMIVFMCGAMAVYEPVVYPLVDFVIAGTLWNISFSFSYNYTFRI